MYWKNGEPDLENDNEILRERPTDFYTMKLDRRARHSRGLLPPLSKRSAQFRGHLRLRPLLWLVVSLMTIYWVVSVSYIYLVDVCDGALHTQFICNQYRRGHISGSLCSKLCDREEMTLDNCIEQRLFHSSFLWRHWEVHVNNMNLKVRPILGEGADPPFYVPEQGTSMEQFRLMVTSFVGDKLGTGDHNALIDSIMNTADVNNDAKVTLAEAKSIWALLQDNSYFIKFVFSDTEHVPALQGFCGDAYAYDYFQKRQLFPHDRSGFFYWLFPKLHTWLYPSWANRAKIVIGVLEFAMEVFQHGSEGSFYMCDIDESKIGYSTKFDTKIIDTLKIISENELTGILSQRDCKTNAECVYTEQCTTSCDTTAGKCSGSLLRPNLYYVCRMIEEYLGQDPPHDIALEIDRLLGRCAQLGINNTTQSQVEHSLLLNDLKLLLWKRISYSES